MLRDIQAGTCFYCTGRLGKELDEDAGGDKAAHVDHFVLGGLVWRGRGKEELVALGTGWERVLSSLSG